ncbi:MAG: hypothetical protein ACREDP_22640, partial [Bradyrhizobium sp.]
MVGVICRELACFHRDAVASGLQVLNGLLGIRNEERFEPATYCEEICECSINGQNSRWIWLSGGLDGYKMVNSLDWESTCKDRMTGGDGLTRDSTIPPLPSCDIVGSGALGVLAIANVAQHVRVLDHEVGAVRMQDSKLGKSLQADRH